MIIKQIGSNCHQKTNAREENKNKSTHPFLLSQCTQTIICVLTQSRIKCRPRWTTRHDFETTESPLVDIAVSTPVEFIHYLCFVIYDAKVVEPRSRKNYKLLR